MLCYSAKPGSKKRTADLKNPFSGVVSRCWCHCCTYFNFAISWTYKFQMSHCRKITKTRRFRGEAGLFPGQFATGLTIFNSGQIDFKWASSVYRAGCALAVWHLTRPV
jgi:hypothetical protein